MLCKVRFTVVCRALNYWNTYTCINICTSFNTDKHKLTRPVKHQPVSYKVIKFHKSPSIKRLFDIELLNKKLLIVV